MKRSVLFFGSLFLVSCGGGTTPVVEPKWENNTSLEHTTILWNEGSQFLTIESGETWTIKLEFEQGVTAWAQLERTAGDGDDLIKLTVNLNNSPRTRNVDIVVQFETETKRLTLTQKFNHQEPVEPNDIVPNWTELPALPDNMGAMLYVKHFATDASNSVVRNYSMLYDPETYLSYWVAYPLHGCYTATNFSRTDNFVQDPLVDPDLQILLTKAYVPGGNPYNRGHQIPAADRRAGVLMLAQTFFCTNMTPQQGSFNSGRWGTTEAKLRTIMGNHAPDTMYVVTGALLHTVGGSETITTITNQSDGKTIPVPRYYYKVAIIKSGTTWKGIGFWYDHLDSSSWTGAINYNNNVRTIREIETLTGFNFFHNIPQTDQDAAEMSVDKSFWGF